MKKLKEAPDLRVEVRKLKAAPSLTGKVEEVKVDDAGFTQEIADVRERIDKVQRLMEQAVNMELDTRNLVNRLGTEVREVESRSIEVREPEIGKKDISATQRTIVQLRAEVQRVADEIAKEIKRLDAGIEEVGYKKSVKYVGGGASVAEVLVAAKADTDIADAISKKHSNTNEVTSVPPEGFLKVSNIYVESESGDLVAIHEQ